MGTTRVAKAASGELIEVFGAGRRWVYVAWDRAVMEPSGEAGKVFGPFLSLSAAEQDARDRFDLEPFVDLPDGANPFEWADSS